MTPKQKAWAEMAVWTFLGGGVGYLAPILTGAQLPPASMVKSIAIGFVTAGIVAVRNRLMPSPLQQDAEGVRTAVKS